MTPCLVIVTELDVRAFGYAGFWSGVLAMREGFTLGPIVFAPSPSVVPNPVLVEALRSWSAEVAGARRRGGVFVLVGSVSGETRTLIRTTLAALEGDQHELLAHESADDWTLTEEHQQKIRLRILQYDPGEAGKYGRRFTLEVGGDTTGYLLVTKGNFDPKQSKFETDKENWVWPSGKAWTAPFTLDYTNEDTPNDYGDEPDAHPHGPLIKELDVLPAKIGGETRYLYTPNNTDYVAIFKETGKAPRYYASPNLVNTMLAQLKLAKMIFKVNDAVALKKGTWWTYR